MLIQRIANKLFSILDVSLLRNSKYGIKCFNSILNNNISQHWKIGRPQALPAHVLHLNIDGIKDDFTLLGTKITDSPYLELMRFIAEGKDIRRTEYVDRNRRGILDVRLPVKVDSRYIRTLHKKYEENAYKLSAGLYSPVKVYCVYNKYFIADGKHRAALCAARGVDPLCVEISHLILCDSYIQWMYRKMLKHRAHYMKHIKHMSIINNEP